MERKLYQKLLEWKKESQGKTAVLIDGARRVGKSYLAEEFAKREYHSYLKINFDNVKESVKNLFLDYLDDLDTFYSYLSAYYSIDLHKRNTLIIFDEVQCFPKARGAIKYLVADGRYDFIETGSLLSIKENTEDIVIPSEEEHLYLHPLDYEEFLWAIGEEHFFDSIKNSYMNNIPLPLSLHKKAMDLFRRYLLIGGMPQVINAYLNTHSFQKADKEKRGILTLYRNDIIKHSSYKAKAAAIFDQIPTELSKHEKVFRLSSLKKGAKGRDYEDTFFYLSDSGICNMCYKAKEPNIGLSMNEESSALKCYMGDTGLLISLAFSEKNLADEELYEKLLSGNLTFNEGMITENIVSQMLVASGHSLYYYSQNSPTNSEERMEIDFLIAKENLTNRHNISPLEVKSGNRTTSASLNKFIAKFKDYLNTPYIIYDGEMKKKDDKNFLPFYMVPLL